MHSIMSLRSFLSVTFEVIWEFERQWPNQGKSSSKSHVLPTTMKCSYWWEMTDSHLPAFPFVLEPLGTSAENTLLLPVYRMFLLAFNPGIVTGMLAWVRVKPCTEKGSCISLVIVTVCREGYPVFLQSLSLCVEKGILCFSSQHYCVWRMMSCVPQHHCVWRMMSRVPPVSITVCGEWCSVFFQSASLCVENDVLCSSSQHHCVGRMLSCVPPVSITVWRMMLCVLPVSITVCGEWCLVFLQSASLCGENAVLRSSSQHHCVENDALCSSSQHHCVENDTLCSSSQHHCVEKGVLSSVCQHHCVQRQVSCIPSVSTSGYKGHAFFSQYLWVWTVVSLSWSQCFVTYPLGFGCCSNALTKLKTMWTMPSWRRERWQGMSGCMAHCSSSTNCSGAAMWRER